MPLSDLPAVHVGKSGGLGSGVVRREIGAQHGGPDIADTVLAVEQILAAIHLFLQRGDAVALRAPNC